MHINEKNILQNFKISGIFFGLCFFWGFAVKGDQKYRELAMLRDCTVCPLKHRNVVQLITDEFCHHQIQYTNKWSTRHTRQGQTHCFIKLVVGQTLMILFLLVTERRPSFQV